MSPNGTPDHIDFEHLKQQAKLERAKCMRHYGAALIKYSRHVVPRRMRVQIRPLHIIGVGAILFISFGVTVFILSPPTSEASVRSHRTHISTAVARPNINSMEIGQPPYP